MFCAPYCVGSTITIPWNGVRAHFVDHARRISGRHMVFPGPGWLRTPELGLLMIIDWSSAKASSIGRRLLSSVPASDASSLKCISRVVAAVQYPDIARLRRQHCSFLWQLQKQLGPIRDRRSASSLACCGSSLLATRPGVDVSCGYIRIVYIPTIRCCCSLTTTSLPFCHPEQSSWLCHTILSSLSLYVLLERSLSFRSK